MEPNFHLQNYVPTRFDRVALDWEFPEETYSEFRDRKRSEADTAWLNEPHVVERMMLFLKSDEEKKARQAAEQEQLKAKLLEIYRKGIP